MTQRVTQGMGIFIAVWLTQLFSLLGSGLTSFVLGIWAYQKTGSITQFALISMLAQLPSVLLFPVAGALVDRWNRRLVMLICDLGSGLALLSIAMLVAQNGLQVWHIYIMVAVNSIFSAYHWPAYTAATTLLVDSKRLGLVSGLMQLGEASKLAAPLLGGLLLELVQLQGVILIDFITFGIAFATLSWVRFPRLEPPTTQTSLLEDALTGLRYIGQRSGLLALLLFMATANFLLGIVEVLTTPLALSFTSPSTLGAIFSIGGLGIVFGSLLVSQWNDRLRLTSGIVASQIVSGLAIVVAAFYPAVLTLSMAVFMAMSGLAVINGCSQLILRKQVPHELQGRVFALSRTLSDATLPLGFGVAGFLADQVFTPLVAVGGPLSSTVGQVLGTSYASGVRLLLLVVSSLTIIVSLLAYGFPQLMQVEQEQ